MPINYKSKSILLVDDDYDIVNLFKDLLENRNYEVTGFTNPLEALEHYKTNWKRYGLVRYRILLPAQLYHRTINMVQFFAYRYYHMNYSFISMQGIKSIADKNKA